MECFRGVIAHGSNKFFRFLCFQKFILKVFCFYRVPEISNLGKVDFFIPSLRDSDLFHHDIFQFKVSVQQIKFVQFNKSSGKVYHNIKFLSDGEGVPFFFSDKFKQVSFLALFHDKINLVFFSETFVKFHKMSRVFLCQNPVYLYFSFYTLFPVRVFFYFYHFHDQRLFFIFILFSVRPKNL